MEDILRPIYQEWASQVNTLGVLLIKKNDQFASLSDTSDAILLIVVKEAEYPVTVKHYTYQEKNAALHTITKLQLNEWLRSGTNRKLIQWLVKGKVLFDRNEFMSDLKNTLMEYPANDRKFKMGIEFSKLICCYMDGKIYFEDQQYLDAYSHIVRSLHHLGRLSLIDKGLHPEMTVWSQVKHIEPEVYQLYNELVNSEEELGKRLELLFLASDFLIHSRVEEGTSYLFDVLKRKDMWTIDEVLKHPSLKLYEAYFETLFEYLIEKHYIEVVHIETQEQGIYQRHYKLAEKLLQKNN
ncbi:nucleotidyltransferase-like protein [Niallia sp. XMNu-256]|uniref:nucleotidyltransferase-like protein n=1 Tax=Niallia sp. XMNu-256 TaxID=3082444 RepID=UPI0030D162AB